MADNSIQLLDCTLRDGGMGFEDSLKNENHRLSFDSDSTDRVIDALKNARVDIVEIGSIETTKEDKKGVAIYQDIEEISKRIPSDKLTGQFYAALYRGPDTPISDIPQWDHSKCSMARLIVRYSELARSMKFCRGLAKKGYKVFIQPAITMRYTEDEIQMLIDTANDIDAYALYFVDSYGYMMEQDVLRFFKRYNAELKPSIRIGFHAHNNMGLAFSNVISFINHRLDRNIIVDSCVLGIGQGAGNLQTEVIADYLNRYYGADYNYSSVLDACETVEKYWTQNLWGYSVTELLSAINKTAYKFATSLRNKYNMSFSDINRILSHIPEKMRHRYTPEDTVELLKLLNVPRKEDGGKHNEGI